MDKNNNSLKGINKRKAGLWLGLIIIIALGLAVIEINKPKFADKLPVSKSTASAPSGEL